MYRTNNEVQTYKRLSKINMTVFKNAALTPVSKDSCFGEFGLRLLTGEFTSFFRIPLGFRALWLSPGCVWRLYLKWKSRLFFMCFLTLFVELPLCVYGLAFLHNVNDLGQNVDVHYQMIHSLKHMEFIYLYIIHYTLLLVCLAYCESFFFVRFLILVSFYVYIMVVLSLPHVCLVYSSGPRLCLRLWKLIIRYLG